MLIMKVIVVGVAASNRLLQAKMDIIPYSTCYSLAQNITRGGRGGVGGGASVNVSSTLNNETMLCVGTLPTVGGINFCKVRIVL